MTTSHANSARSAALDMSAEEFRELGHGLVDRLADYYAALPQRAVTAGEAVDTIRAELGPRGLPQTG
ncbi:MAG: hypothetical protein OET16_10940, partial [Chromatiales bacterium]|nr:hypothetical protein [Chromatiales bacterium]